jgi:hypothetical protein
LRALRFTPSHSCLARDHWRLEDPLIAMKLR